MGLFPVLDFDDVPFRIGKVLKCQQPQARHVPDRKRTDSGTAMVKDGPRCRRDIIDCKGDMGESRGTRVD